jgi:hypothetical protein
LPHNVGAFASTAPSLPLSDEQRRQHPQSQGLKMATTEGTVPLPSPSFPTTATDSQRACCLVTCGHLCSLCRPIVQQLLLLCQQCVSRRVVPHPVLPFLFVCLFFFFVCVFVCSYLVDFSLLLYFLLLTLSKQDLIGCIRNLLPVVAENDVTKFRTYLEVLFPLKKKKKKTAISTTNTHHLTTQIEGKGGMGERICHVYDRNIRIDDIPQGTHVPS